MKILIEICISLFIERIARFLRVLVTIGLEGEALFTAIFVLEIAIFDAVERLFG